MTTQTTPDRVALARHILSLGDIRNTPCSVNTQQWARHERLLDEVIAGNPTNAELRSAAAPLLALCARCPRSAMQECGQWALVEEFSGVAGGTVMRNGRIEIAEHRARNRQQGSAA